jgi:hypothetical protein
LNGTETYGDFMNDKEAWAIKFDITKVDRVIVKSNDEDEEDPHLKSYSKD